MSSMQRRLPFPRGRRRGKAGRPKTGAAGVPHLRREALSPREPVHVTLKAAAGTGFLRKQRMLVALEAVFAGAKERLGMRVVHYSIQGNHLHLLVEAEDRAALSRAMQGLAIRAAKAINRVLRRHGHVWADRYHAHVLRSLRETAHALRYVLGNFARHARGWGEQVAAFADEFSSVRFLGLAGEDAPVAEPRTWMLRVGWRTDRAPRRPLPG